MAERREYQGAAASTTLAADITNVATTITLATNTGWPTGATGPFVIVIDRGNSSEEKIKCSSRSGNSLTVATSGRGFDGTTATTHKSPAVVRHVFAANDIDLVNKHAADSTQDDHSQYVHNSNARTVSANHNYTGNPTFSGTPVFSGAPSFTGNPVFSNAPHFTGTPLFDNMGNAFDVAMLDQNTGSAGTSNKPARADHKHPLNLNAIRDAIIPSGVIAPFAGSSPPAGWLICNGAAISRTTYGNLFAVIGTTYGTGDGVTTFNLPNFVNRVPVGSGGSYGFANTGGQAQQTLSSSNLPAHSHGINDPGHTHGVNISDPGHTHGVDGGDTGFRIGVSHTSTYGFSTANIGQAMTLSNLNSATTGITASTSSVGTGISTQSAGSGSSFSVEQPWIALNYIIKVA